MANYDGNTIDEYLLGRMNHVEQEEFEKLLENDPELAEQVAQRRETIAALELIGDHVLKQHLLTLHDKNLAVIHRRRKRRRYLAAAATLLLIISSTVVFYFSTKKTKAPQRIFAQYFQAYPISFGERGQNDQIAILNFSNEYNQENYAVALQSIVGLPDSLIDSKLRLAKGIAHLFLDQHQSAQSDFNHLLSNNDPMYFEQSKWYLALSFLELGQKEESQKLLTEINDQEGHFKQREAAKILAELK